MYENRNIKKDVVILEIRNNSAYIHESRQQTQLSQKKLVSVYVLIGFLTYSPTISIISTMHIK